MDWLMETALDAVEAANSDDATLPSWLASKRKEKAKATRLESLRFICSSLDRANQLAVCKELDISIEDLQATARVLQKV